MCTICHNSYPNCPVCSDKPTYNECQECKGTGQIYYYATTGEQIYSEDEFLRLEKEGYEVCIDLCDACDGKGELEEEPIDYETFMNL